MNIKKLNKAKVLSFLMAIVMLAIAFSFFKANSKIASASTVELDNEVAVPVEEIVGIAPFAVTHPTAVPPYLDIRIIGKNSGTWIIKVTNNNSFDVEVVYNEKMCFEGDAKNWSGLRHIRSFTLPAGVSTVPLDDRSYDVKHLEISQNGFAGYITISFVHPVKQNNTSYRYISFANKLNTNTTMSVYYTSVAA